MSEGKYVIFSDSCVDLPPDMVKKADLHILPLEFTIEGETYQNYPDNHEYENHVFYEKLRSGVMAKTSMVSPAKYLEALTPFAKDGFDILIIAFSSALSGTYNSACQAKVYLHDNFPQTDIEVIDSLSASGGQGYLAYMAGMNRLSGMSMRANKEWVEQHIQHLAHWFTVDDLHFLKRGGRLSASKAFLGSMLNLKPVLHVDSIGRLVPVTNVRGRKQSIMSIIQHFRDTAIDPDRNFVIITHGDDIVTARFLGEKLADEFKVPEVIYSDLGPVIGSHSGPNTLALFFLATER